VVEVKTRHRSFKSDLALRRTTSQSESAEARGIALGTANMGGYLELKRLKIVEVEYTFAAVTRNGGGGECGIARATRDIEKSDGTTTKATAPQRVRFCGTASFMTA